jgi:hypothetical protein
MLIVLLKKVRFFQDMAPYMYQHIGKDGCFHRHYRPIYTASYSLRQVSNNNFLNDK